MFSTCVFCDGDRALQVDGNGDEAALSPANPAMPAICSKAIRHADYGQHVDRVLHPLKNVGSRWQPQWEQISWDEALDEIARLLVAIADVYGPEAIAFAETPLNTGFGGITRRFMNHLGSPNYIVPTLLCMGNTAQVHRAVYGWMTSPAWDKTDLIIYFGQDRGPEKWPREYYNLKAALGRGAKLVRIDPRLTETSKLADEHLRIRYGTDAALVLAWINVVIEEELYDHAFVEKHTTGFDELAAHIARFTPEWAAEVRGIEESAIRRTARMYSQAKAAVIPWGVVPDMQSNSTALIQGQCILRAICGFLNKSEIVFGPAIGARTNSQVADFTALALEQRAKQLGSDDYPLLSFKGMQLYADVYERAGFDHLPDIMACSCTAHPPSLFRAMRTGKPYPVKAVLCIGNNTVMSYANQQGIADALLEQLLVVVFDHWMTPTAQLADYVLPADAWMERDALGPAYDMAPVATFSRAFLEAPGECRDWYAVVKGLADRMGMQEAFPWAECHEYYDWRMSPVDCSYGEAAGAPAMGSGTPAFGTFLTPPTAGGSPRIRKASSEASAEPCATTTACCSPTTPGTWIPCRASRTSAEASTPASSEAALRAKHASST